jgi:TonB family protein
MNRENKRAFLISSLLHAVVFVVLLLSALFGMFRKPAPIHVFTLHAAPVAQEKTSVPGPPESAVEFEIPKLAPAVSWPTAIRTPVSVQDRPVEPAKPITYEDFVRRHGAPKKTVAAPASPKPLEVRKIDIDSILDAPKGAAVDTRRTAESPDRSESRDALMRYLGALKAGINQGWLKPASLSGRPFETVVEFLVPADGHIVEVTIVRSSGSEIFDASVLAAFRNVPSVGPTPDRRAYRPRLTFRMVE